MRRSTSRILTTHTGSLPRPAKVVELLLAERRGIALDAAVEQAVADVIARQKAAGIDIINDGEQGRTDYTVHVIDRLNGFEGQSDAPRGTGEPEFPELAQLLSNSPRRSSIARPARGRCRGGILPRRRPTSRAPRRR
jgi:5-methyltetrahydropteroyltriglutamate--homocysteine methyltransferase